jgi:hypothetical protein
MELHRPVCEFRPRHGNRHPIACHPLEERARFARIVRLKAQVELALWGLPGLLSGLGRSAIRGVLGGSADGVGLAAERCQGALPSRRTLGPMSAVRVCALESPTLLRTSIAVWLARNPDSAVTSCSCGLA